MNCSCNMCQKMEIIPSSEEIYNICIKTFTGMSFTIDVQNSFTIDNIMVIIWVKKGIPMKCQRICYKGKQ